MADDPHIVLHLGPEKCGSTSIQSAIATDGPLADVVLAPTLDPYAVIALEQDPVDPSILSAFRALIETNLAQLRGRTLVLSHEMSFKSLPILRQLAGLATEYSRNVSAVAYLRRQSDFIVSGFGQWHFRCPERLSEAVEVLKANDLDPDVFWAIERHLIASILGGWRLARQPSGHLYLNWAQSIPERAELLNTFGITLSVGALPSKGSHDKLIPDFLQRIGLDPGLAKDVPPLRNPSFHPDLVESVAAAIVAGHSLPGPHDANDFYASMSKAASKTSEKPMFFNDLRNFIDTAFHEANRQLAHALSAPELAFTPQTSTSRARILSVIQAEAERRGYVDRNIRKRDIALRATMAALLFKTYTIRS